ncbi:MAG TPA: hypothetical protein VES42_14285, partial [Pilimelia sp.]|nr:hypothetical protein [Pilimelia sp.]
GATGLGSPRYATVLALQPVLPLLAYEQLHGPTGWALVLTVVASLDVLLLLTVARRGPLVPPGPAGRPTAVDVEPDPAAPVAEPDRPETRPEEPDLVMPLDSVSAPPPRQRRAPRFFPGPRPAGTTPAGVSGVTAPAPVPPSATWLRELMFALVTVGVAGGLAYATVALLDAAAPGAAVRAAGVLLLAAGIGVLAARISGNDTARQLAGGALTLAVLGAAARVTDVAAPGQALVSTAAVIALTGVVVRLLPDTWRRGPQWASAVAVTVLGIVVAGDVLRAAVAPVRAATPAWQADVDAYAGQVYPAAGPAGWQLAVAAFFLTVAAALALPAMLRHEASVAGLVLSALAVPASFQLPWSQAPWPLVVTAILLGAGGLAARTRRVAVTHIAGAGVLGLFGAAIAAAQPWLTAAALTALAGAGLLVAVAARQLRTNLYAWQVGDWAAGGAAFALPGAVAAATVSANDPQGVGAATVPALAASFVAVAVTLSVAAVIQVARREISTPLTLGTGLGALAVTLAAFRADGSTAPDIWVGALLMAAAVLLFLAPSIDAGRRADRWLDGPDIAAAAATVAVIGALGRVAALAFPNAELAATAAVVLLVALGIRAMPADWRRGPTLGTAVGGAVVLLIAGYTALSGGLRVLAAPGPIWRSDLAAWPSQAADGAWQAPVALVLLAVAATAALPRPAGYDVAAVCAGLATIGTPAALGLPWWSPLVVGGAVMI